MEGFLVFLIGLTGPLNATLQTECPYTLLCCILPILLYQLGPLLLPVNSSALVSDPAKTK